MFSNRTYVITRYRINMPFAYLKKKTKNKKQIQLFEKKITVIFKNDCIKNRKKPLVSLQMLITGEILTSNSIRSN